MKLSFKKILSLILIIALTFIGIKLSASPSEVTDIGTAKYYVENVKEVNELPNGVKQYTHLGYTSAITGEVTDMGMNVTEPFVPNKYYPQQVNILEVPSSKDVSIVPWAYISNSEWNLKTVRDIAKDYEAKNPGYKVIAGVNGDFFDIMGGNMYPFTPNNLHVANGEVYKSVHVNSAVGFKNDGSSEPLIGNEQITRKAYPTLAIYDENNIVKEFNIDVVNDTPSENQIAVVYPKYGVEYHNATPKTVPINVDNAFIVDNGEYSIPFSAVDAAFGNVSDNAGFYGKGTITSFGSGLLGQNDFAIVTDNLEVMEALKVGVKIRVQYEFTGAFEDVDNIIGVNQTILYDGKKVHSIKQRAPRTMVGVKEDGTLVFGVIDGRQPTKGMYGTAMAEMAAVLTHYGVTEAYNLDGGGSSTMIILDDKDYRVTNSPSDSKERTDANALLVVIRKPEVNISLKEASSTSITLNVDILSNNGYDEDSLYLKVNDTYTKIENNTVVFKELNYNTSYNYELYYKKNEEFFKLYIYGQIKTGKRDPIINDCYMYYEGDNLIFLVDITDVDKVIVNGTVNIGEESKTMVNGLSVFNKFRGKSIKDYSINLTIDTDNGMKEKVVLITDLQVGCELSILIDISMEEFNKLVN